MRRIAALALAALLVGGGCVERADPDDPAVAHAIEEAAPATEGPQTYGDDESLDAMQDDCEGGDMLACDLLWLSSPEGSAYDRVAATCGGTTENTGEFCTPYPELDEDGYAPEDSEGLPQLDAQCKDGNMTACDVLFLIVPEGHELEEVAFTCGGRARGGAVVDVDCRTSFG